MKINYGISNKLKGHRILTIGNFDGVHKGHQSLLKFCCSYAKKNQIISTVITFKPHPKVFLQNKSHGCIQTLRDKATEIKESKIDQLLILPFNERLANLPAQKFIELLIKHLGMKAIVVGKDFRFGKARGGNVNMLEQAGKLLKFKTFVVEDILHENEKISSSQIRNYAREGFLDKVSFYRGKLLTLTGRVVHGKKIGRTLGYPTLNIHVPDDLCISGIFAVTVSQLQSNEKITYLPAIASLGRRPTVENCGKLILEVHILDWNLEIYGQLISVEIHKKIREEIKFDNLEALKKQMKIDEVKTRQFFELNEK
jgi:riboflavin kinase/FMN adenylyltransferase